MLTNNIMVLTKRIIVLNMGSGPRVRERRPRGGAGEYMGTSLIRNRHPLGPYGRIMPRALRGSWGGGHFLMSEVPLYGLGGVLSRGVGCFLLIGCGRKGVKIGAKQW